MSKHPEMPPLSEEAARELKEGAKELRHWAALNEAEGNRSQSAQQYRSADEAEATIRRRGIRKR